jgi:hypothetical protein
VRKTNIKTASGPENVTSQRIVRDFREEGYGVIIRWVYWVSFPLVAGRMFEFEVCGFGFEMKEPIYRGRVEAARETACP